VLDRDLNAALNLKNLAVRAVRPELEVSASNVCGEDVRPTAVLLAASLKQKPSIESRVRFQ